MKRKLEKLIEPFQLGNLTLKNRMIMAPMVINYAQDDGSISERLLNFYKARALGGVGLIIVGGAYVHPNGKGYSHQLGIHDEAMISGLKRLTETVHQEDCKVFLQLDHAGRQTDSSITKTDIVAPSALACPTKKEIPVELDQEAIQVLVESYAQSALRAKEAGFDGVELHGAHGSLLAQFLSRYSNKRKDQYGGSLENNLRFPLEVFKAVRKAVGEDFIISYRFSADEYVHGGLSLKESKLVAKELEKAGVDLLSVSAGAHQFMMMVVQPMGIKQGCLAHLAEGIKQTVQVPVVAVGRLNDPWIAEEILQTGKSDLVALGRALLADANFPQKVINGDWDSVRICIACNQECIGRLAQDNDILCLINAQTGNEDKNVIEKTEQPKKILVIGGGTAGLEAARVAALRGHDVYLYEKTDELGGKLFSVALPPRKEVINKLRSSLIHHVHQVGVKIHLNSEVNAELIEQLQPDTIILASGSTPNLPPIPGINAPNVCTADDVLNKRVETGERVAVLGNGLVGAETADWLSEVGRKVTLIGKSPEVAPGSEILNKTLMITALEEKNVCMLNGVAIKEILSDGVKIETEEGEQQEIHDIDTIVVALGYKPNVQLLEYIEKKKIPVFTAGDCVRPRRIAEAIYEAFRAGMSV